MREGELRGMISYYGGKWSAARKYPAPEHDTIIEPFAGGAGYSLRYADRRVVLVEKNLKVASVWRYLVASTPEDILALPLLGMHDSVDDLHVCQEAKWLIGFWCNGAVVAPCKRLSAWGRAALPNNPAFFWSSACRARVAAQVACIKHWQIVEGDYTQAPDIRATWFVDPPYQRMGAHYPNGPRDIDYQALGDWCRTRSGTTIVCEQDGAEWLPFAPAYIGKSAHIDNGVRRKVSEVVWINRQ